MKQTIKKGDNVLVISGKDKGKRGTILQVIPQDNRIVVEGVNVRKRHMKPTRTQPRGGIIELPKPIHRSNVLLIDPNTDQAVRSAKRPAA